MIRKFLRKWLGIEQNEKDIAYEHKKINKAMDQSNSNASKIRGNQSRIDSIERKIKKH